MAETAQPAASTDAEVTARAFHLVRNFAIWFLFVTNVVTLSVMGPVVVAARPGLIKVFKDFDAELPGISMFFFSIPDWVLISLPILIIIGLVALVILSKKPNLNLATQIAVAVFSAVYAAMFVFSVFLPYVNLIKSVT